MFLFLWSSSCFCFFHSWLFGLLFSFIWVFSNAFVKSVRSKFGDENSPLHLSQEQVWSLLLLDLQREQHLRKISSFIGLKIWLNSLLPRENIGYVKKGVNLWSKYCLRSEISFFFSTNIVLSVYLSIQLSIFNQPAVYLSINLST